MRGVGLRHIREVGRTVCSPVVRFWNRHGVVGTLSGEFFLDDRPNGGAVIARRTVWTSTIIYLITLAVYERLAPGATWMPSFPHADALRVTLPWLGAMTAAMYAGFYSRFASQWTYLAGLYNQMMAAAVAQPTPTSKESNRVLAAWRAGFVEDAEDLHLATKPSYAGVITTLLKRADVRKVYIATTLGGEARLANLEQRCLNVLGADSKQTAAVPSVVLGSQTSPLRRHPQPLVHEHQTQRHRQHLIHHRPMPPIRTRVPTLSSAGTTFF